MTSSAQTLVGKAGLPFCLSAVAMAACPLPCMAQLGSGDSELCVIDDEALRTAERREQVRLVLMLLAAAFDRPLEVTVQVGTGLSPRFATLPGGLPRAEVLAALHGDDFVPRLLTGTFAVSDLPHEREWARFALFTGAPTAEPLLPDQAAIQVGDPPEPGLLVLQACQLAAPPANGLCAVGTLGPDGVPDGDWDVAVVLEGSTIRIFDSRSQVTVAPPLERIFAAAPIVVVRRPPCTAAAMLGAMQITEYGRLRFAQCGEGMVALGLRHSILLIDGREVDIPATRAEEYLEDGRLPNGLHTVGVRRRTACGGPVGLEPTGAIRMRTAMAGSYCECWPGTTLKNCPDCVPHVSDALRASTLGDRECLFVPWWERPSGGTYWVSVYARSSSFSRDCRGPMLLEPVTALELRADPLWVLFCGCVALCAVLCAWWILRRPRVVAIAIQMVVSGGLREAPRIRWDVLPLHAAAAEDLPLRVALRPTPHVLADREMVIVEPLLPARRGIRAPLRANVLFADGRDVYVLLDRRTAKAITRGRLRPTVVRPESLSAFRPNLELGPVWRWAGRGLLAGLLFVEPLMLAYWISGAHPVLTQRGAFSVLALASLVVTVGVVEVVRQLRVPKPGPLANADVYHQRTGHQEEGADG